MADTCVSPEEAQALASRMLAAMDEAERKRSTEPAERIATALERIATALAAQLAAQEASAAFARMLTKGIEPEAAVNSGFEDYRLAATPPGEGEAEYEVKVDGQWRWASLAEEQEIAAIIQKRRWR